MGIAITIDGSALGNPGPGGWAVLVRTEGGETMLAGASPGGHAGHPDNERVDMAAQAEAEKARIALAAAGA